MITTSTTLTLSLATAMGVYMIAGGLSGLLSRDRWRGILDEFMARPGLTYISGVFVFVIGVAVILAHNLWTDPLAIIVSLIGWVAAIEGLVLIVYPGPLLRWALSFVRPGAVMAFAIFTIALGAVLVVLGLTGRAGVV